MKIKRGKTRVVLTEEEALALFLFMQNFYTGALLSANDFRYPHDKVKNMFDRLRDEFSN